MKKPFEFNHILYAEDDEDIQALCKIALEDIGGFRVTFCDTGQRTLEMAKDCKPDLLLLDVMMPDMNGPMILAKLRQLPHLDSVPAIFMTARIQPDDLLQYKSLGVINIITKPFDPMTLAEQIKQDLRAYYA